jgi:hypothetical protein
MQGADGFGAIQAVEKFREKYPETHIVINSGFTYHVQQRWANDSSLTFVPKGDPDHLLQTVNSVLAAQGVQQAVSIRREGDGSPAYADSPRLSRGWMAAGFGAVSAAWTATMLGVTSTMNKALTVTALVMAFLGGLLLGFGRNANKARLALYFVGSVLILFSAFGMPLLMNGPAASP